MGYTSNSCYNPIGGICYGPLGDANDDYVDNEDNDDADDTTHNCLASAGYRWCKSKGECIQVSNSWNTDCPGQEVCPDGQKWCDSQLKCYFTIGGQCPNCPSNKPRWCYTSNSCYNPDSGICYGPLDNEDYEFDDDWMPSTTDDDDSDYDNDNLDHSHGCLASAGYAYCPLYARCYRPWEEICIQEGDSNGCKSSTGYHWCPTKQECLFIVDLIDETDVCPYCKQGQIWCDNTQECIYKYGGYCPSCPKHQLYCKVLDSCVDKKGDCPDLVTTPPKPMETPAPLIGGCEGTEYGCCHDGKTARSDRHGTNCHNKPYTTKAGHGHGSSSWNTQSSTTKSSSSTTRGNTWSTSWSSTPSTSSTSTTSSEKGERLLNLAVNEDFSNSTPTTKIITVIINRTTYKAKIIYLLDVNGYVIAGTCSFTVTKIEVKVNASNTYIAFVSASCAEYNNGNTFTFKLQFVWVRNTGDVDENSMQIVN